MCLLLLPNTTKILPGNMKNLWLWRFLPLALRKYPLRQRWWHRASHTDEQRSISSAAAGARA
jgi:hypothetical protein